MTDIDHNSALLRGKLESWALRLLREGATPRHVTETTGVPIERLRALTAEQPRSLGRCHDERCGRPQDGPGHPRKGWVQIKVAGEPKALWFHTWACVINYAARRRAAV
jgi:hypothetical protein